MAILGEEDEEEEKIAGTAKGRDRCANPVQKYYNSLIIEFHFEKSQTTSHHLLLLVGQTK